MVLLNILLIVMFIVFVLQKYEIMFFFQEIYNMGRLDVIFNLKLMVDFV